MALNYYYACFGISFFILWLYMSQWERHFDIRIAVINVLIPITDLGYCLLATSESIDSAIIANDFIYIGGCFMQLIISLVVFDMCKVQIPKRILLSAFSLSSILYLTILTTQSTKWFYKNVYIFKKNGISYITKDYGFMHTMFYAIVIIYALVSIATLVICVFKKKVVSYKVIMSLMFCELVVVVAYLSGRLIIKWVELIPAAYIIAQWILLRINNKVYLYNLDDSVLESHMKNEKLGYFSVDNKLNYLGCNEAAGIFFPELLELFVDRRMIPITDNLKEFIADVAKVDEARGTVTRNLQVGDKDIKISVGYLFSGKTIRGYQYVITDVTKEQEYIRLLNNYNQNLQNEVEIKTRNVVEMQDKLILGMADMVENRDLSTGGHIKRTSQIIRIFMDEINEKKLMNFDKKFCDNMIKAAPMHDLGKIAVDDVILRKPGKFEPEEFEMMKTHAAKGAQIVRQILSGIDDADFATLAENVAHYHHERYDGSGYPMHLKGEDIPIEARIMAIADVYDALVSKRCYKDKMSFEQAFNIIEDGMGSQFDPQLNQMFVNVRAKLEEFYISLDDM